MRLRAAVSGLTVFAALGCAGEPADASAWEPTKQALVLDMPAWNAAGTELGTIAAVTEDGDDVVVFGEQGATRLSGGAVSGQDSSISAWRVAGRIPAADGAGFWVVGVDSAGQLFRMRGSNRLEKISQRYGLEDEVVVDLAHASGASVVFGLEQHVAIADGKFVTRYDLPAASGVAATLDASSRMQRVAAIAKGGRLRLLEVESKTLSSLQLDGVSAAAFWRGKLLIATNKLLYEWTGGQPSVLYSARSSLHGLVVSAEQLWIADGERLCLHDANEFSCSASGTIAMDARLSSSVAGDVWVLSAGVLKRFARAASGDEAVWRKDVVSVYARVCSSCHAPGGSSGIDLSSYGAWGDRRAAIDKRVLVDRNMPPDRALSDADRGALEAWVKAGSP